MGFDEVTPEDEVVEAINQEFNMVKDMVNIIKIIKGKYGQNTATIEVPRREGKKMVATGKVKIGWLNCNIKERIQMVRCYKCLEYGHRRNDCKAAVNKEITCLRCGEDGHLVKDCSNNPRCIKFKVEGHRANQISCPMFKKAVEEERRRRRTSVTPSVTN